MDSSFNRINKPGWVLKEGNIIFGKKSYAHSLLVRLNMVFKQEGCRSVYLVATYHICAVSPACHI